MTQKEIGVSREGKLEVKMVLEDFRKAERSKGSRGRSLKIDGSFEEAMKKILKAKPEPKKPRSSKS